MSVVALTVDSVIGLNTDRPKLRIHSQLQYAREYGHYIKRQTKNNKVRDIPLSGEALECVKRLIRRREEYKALDTWNPKDGFENLLMLRPDGSFIRRSQDTEAWRAMLKEFDIPYFRHHLVRHVAGTRFLEQGFDSETLGAIMGHHSATMARHYARQTDERARKAMEKVKFPAVIVKGD
jgi:integrase